MSSEPHYAREALQIHVFLDAALTNGAGRERLLRLWQACGQLGMDRPLPPAADLTLPAAIGGTPGFRQVKVRQSQSPGVYEAMLYTHGDIVGLTVMLAPADDGGTHTAAQAGRVWADLDEQWNRAIGTSLDPTAEEDPVIGTARIYRALTADPSSAPHTPEAVGDELRRLVPGTSATPGRLSEHIPLDIGLSLWEVTPTQADLTSRDRRLITTAPADDTHEERLDSWVWADGSGTPVPLTRYLRHAAVVRHQHRVRAKDDEQLQSRHRRLRQEGDRLLTDCLRLLTTEGRTARTSRRVLVRWEALAQHAQQLLIEERLAAAEASDVCTMGHTVRIASTALADSLGSTGLRPFGSDVRCADQLATLLENDTFYLDIARQRVAEATRIATETATQRLQSHQQYLSLIQTSIIGGLLMALAAVQTLGYKLPLAQPVQGPFIALLATLALCLPTVIIRRWRGGDGGRPGAAFEITSLAATGAAAGWLLNRLAVGAHGALATTAACIAAGAALFTAAGAWLVRRAFS
ncbi:CATRA conflict system CASPASE/TPR repeat-associated protein [Streptomyces sp. NPDC047869]|uniref:CATRA conflict system CASPASE/TPR repeat-associated protein n=1 Tax=Streptomyces sp. NPDC047869 TaxID=3154709 RepID=UPI0034571E9F